MYLSLYACYYLIRGHEFIRVITFSLFKTDLKIISGAD